MISYQLTEFGRPLRHVDRETPVPVGDEVLLRVTACGVCHSDVHLCDGFFDLGQGRRVDLSRGRSLPLTLGHEIAGEVVALGSTAASVAVGDVRVVYPWLGCGECAVCAAGAEHLCAAPRALGVVRDGGFADHVIVPHSRYLFDLTSVDPALACTYACSGLTAYGALEKVRDTVAGRHLLVIGAGGVGSAALSLVRSIVQTTVIVVDVDDARLEVASDAGADAVLNATSSDTGKQIRTMSDGGVAAAIDFVGGSESASLGIGALAQGGELVVVGLFGGSLPLPLPLLPLKQLTIRGSYVGSLREMAELTALVGGGDVRPIPLSERSLEEADAALSDLRHGRAVGRIVLRPGGHRRN